MITGDKQETAINIAVACRLVHHADELLVANEDRSPEAAAELLCALISRAQRQNAAGVLPLPPGAGRMRQRPAAVARRGSCSLAPV